MTEHYDVGLSFAGEDREFVDGVADALRTSDLRFFYDKNEQVRLWGADLIRELFKVYREQCRYTVIFISEHFAKSTDVNEQATLKKSPAFPVMVKLYRCIQPVIAVFDLSFRVDRKFPIPCYQ